MPGAAYVSTRGRDDGGASPVASEGGAGLPRAVRSDGTPRRNPELEQALLRLDELLRHLPSEASLAGRGTTGGNRLEQHRAALVASATEPVDRQVIESTTRLFDRCSPTRSFPAPSSLIARMQIAVLGGSGRERGSSIRTTIRCGACRPHRRDQLGYSRTRITRLSAPVVRPAPSRKKMGGAARRTPSVRRRPEPDRRAPVGAAAGQLRAGTGLVRRAGSFRSVATSCSSTCAAPHDQMGQVRTTPTIAARHRDLGAGDCEGHAHQGQQYEADDERI